MIAKLFELPPDLHISIQIYDAKTKPITVLSSIDLTMEKIPLLCPYLDNQDFIIQISDEWRGITQVIHEYNHNSLDISEPISILDKDGSPLSTRSFKDFTKNEVKFTIDPMFGGADLSFRSFCKFNQFLVENSFSFDQSSVRHNTRKIRCPEIVSKR